MIYILYNPLANNGRGKQDAESYMMKVAGDKVFVDIRSISNLGGFFENLDVEDKVVISGGDGTLQHWINEIPEEALKHRLLYYPTGSGNDFCNDIDYKKEEGFVELNSYIENLPRVIFDGKERRFLNNFAMGIDGYVCEKADEHRKRKKQKINYTTIALKALAYGYKPCKAKIILEDETHEFEHVWMAPTMKGRFYGGGMMIAPMQDRVAEDGMLTLVVVHQKSRMKLLQIFPKIFKGEHIVHTDTVSFFRVKHAKVQFEFPVSIQIDGETYLNVQEYEVYA